VFDISNPAVLNLVGTYDAPGGANALGVYVVGSTLFMTRESSTDDELVIVDVSSPSSPSLLGSIDLGSSAEEVVVLGDFAYVGTHDGASELQVVDVSTPSSPSMAGSYDAGGTSKSQSIAGFGDTVLLGREAGEFHIFDVTTPASPNLLSSYSAGNDVEDIDAYLGVASTYAFLATDEASAEFQLLDITDLAAPTLVGSLDLPADLNGIAYHEDKDRAFAASEDDDQEFMVIAPL
jgi:hypothetical protein